MNIQTLMEELFNWCSDGGEHDYSNSCDTLKCGDPGTEIRKAAVSMFATPDVIRAAVIGALKPIVVIRAYVFRRSADVGYRRVVHGPRDDSLTVVPEALPSYKPAESRMGLLRSLVAYSAGFTCCEEMSAECVAASVVR